MSIQAILDAQQRLVILRSLLDIGGAANESILNDCLDQLGTGRVTRDRVKTLLAWLEEQGLVRIERLATVQVAHLTGRGQDAAEGRAMVPGVKKPRAGD
ncbi:ArsR family transcriptional regulator [Aeromonas salmonicida]|uniref:VpaChn25_0724 family phage protein n=1 Tax=Aeromonas salmonicida TaxID=645 RepID=UPI00342EB05D